MQFPTRPTYSSSVSVVVLPCALEPQTCLRRVPAIPGDHIEEVSYTVRRSCAVLHWLCVLAEYSIRGASIWGFSVSVQPNEYWKGSVNSLAL